MIYRLSAFLMCFFLLTACQTEMPSKTLTVAAASSLNNAFNELGQAFEKESNITIHFSYASSGQLTQQIKQGAPFDVFASAEIFYLKDLAESGFVDHNTISTFGEGRLVLYHPDQPNSIEDFNVLLDNNVHHIAIANPEFAPYGKAATEFLKEINLYEQIQEKVVWGENIRQTYQYVKTGNASFGIVASSLLNENDHYSKIDSKLYNPIEQSIGVISSSPNKEVATKWLNFLKSKQAQDILEKYRLGLKEES
ncbi:molybdate ABC transporter substrate-binding protein [Rossellomorea sp. BNER]|uniref:molybdate ABC transporter substrate-binding protein n=1 Tax=Rossellomorea sp. BNER TaxID=2962031 RepID=UPI003AF29396|nr:molybdate ABC transporter substrate-binding protein [Rossellomorea sp. BNER]